jgi:hypothetical protein
MRFVKITVVNRIYPGYGWVIRYGSFLYGLVADANAFAIASVRFLRQSRIAHSQHLNESVLIQQIDEDEIDYSTYGKNIPFSSSVQTTSSSLIGFSSAGSIAINSGIDHLFDVRNSINCFWLDDTNSNIYPHHFRGVLKNSDFRLRDLPWAVNVAPYSTYLSRVTSSATATGYVSYWSPGSSSRQVFPRFKNGQLLLIPVSGLRLRGGNLPGLTSRKLILPAL